MDHAMDVRWTPFRTWKPVLAGLLPLWLVSLAVMAEGFPRPAVSLEVATASLILAILACMVFLWKRWMTIELVLLSFFPIYLVSAFDEISTTYKTPFIVLCALLLSAGFAGYHQLRRYRWRAALVLLVALGVTYLMAWHAASAFWRMADLLGYDLCFPDAHGCLPLTNDATPWWVLFFKIWP